MSIYLDASVLVPRFVLQTSSAAVDRFIDGAQRPLVVSTYVRGEIGAALSRLVRTRELSASNAQDALVDFDSWIPSRAEELDTENVDIRLAESLVRHFEHGLRMPDAIHIASCQRHRLRLATLDRRLGRVAEALGLASVMPV